MAVITISKESNSSDVVTWLKDHGLDDAVSEFQANHIDGEDFFSFNFSDICQLLPRFKLRKRFLHAWSKVTSENFDSNCLRVPLQVSASSLESQEPKESPTSSQVGHQCSSSTFQLSDCSPSPQVSEGNLSSLEASSSDDMSDISESFPILPQSTVRKSLEFETPSCPRRSPRKRCSSVPSGISTKRQKPEIDALQNSGWVTKFCIPTRWEPDVEKGLENGNLTPLQRCSLIRQLCTSIMAHTAYPTVEERTHIALQLVTKYPFLKGSFGAGHQLWEKKIQARFANVKKRIAKDEKKRLEAEGIVVLKGKPGRKKKQSKRATIPSIPVGETEETLDAHQKKLVEMHRKGNPEYSQVKNLMDITYPKRRREVLMDNIRVWKLLKDYPFLKDDKGAQIKAELGRIEEKENIGKEIRELWELKKPLILAALRKMHSRSVNNVLSKLEDCEEADERELENRCIMTALPYVLGEKASHNHTPGEHFFEIVRDDSEVAEKIQGCSSPRLLAIGKLEEINSLALIAEGMVVVKFRTFSILNAVTCLLAAYYVFNAVYPMGPRGHSKNVYVFLEHILLGRKQQALPISVENLLGQM